MDYGCWFSGAIGSGIFLRVDNGLWFTNRVELERGLPGVLDMPTDCLYARETAKGGYDSLVLPQSYKVYPKQAERGAPQVSTHLRCAPLSTESAMHLGPDGRPVRSRRTLDPQARHARRSSPCTANAWFAALHCLTPARRPKGSGQARQATSTAVSRRRCCVPDGTRTSLATAPRAGFSTAGMYRLMQSGTALQRRRRPRPSPHVPAAREPSSVCVGHESCVKRAPNKMNECTRSNSDETNGSPTSV